LATEWWSKQDGQRLRQILEQRGVSQRQLAGAIEVSKDTVASWVRGSGEPGGGKLRAVAEHLQVSVDSLLGLQTPAPGDPWAKEIVERFAEYGPAVRAEALDLLALFAIAEEYKRKHGG
jgi:transcriptional regulator with XRE-family HTH domain